MKPLPASAAPTDPRWGSAFLELAEGLVMAGAKLRVITRFVDLPVAQVRRMYLALRQKEPPAGPVLQASARFFAVPSKNTSEAWTLQAAIFLGCYEHLGRIADFPPHRGWQLLDAFNAYLRLTDQLARDMKVKRIDINHAYALLTHCGFLDPTGKPELQRRQCPTCLMSYLVVTTERLDLQGCPICAMNANAIRLVQQGMDLKSANRPNGV